MLKSNELKTVVLHCSGILPFFYIEKLIFIIYLMCTQPDLFVMLSTPNR